MQSPRVFLLWRCGLIQNISLEADLILIPQYFYNHISPLVLRYTHFFFSPSCYPAAYEGPGPGIESQLQLRPTLQAAATLAPLTHCARQGSNLCPGTAETPPAPVHHSRNSRCTSSLMQRISAPTFFCLFVCLFRATPAAYGGSQARS